MDLYFRFLSAAPLPPPPWRGAASLHGNVYAPMSKNQGARLSELEEENKYIMHKVHKVPPLFSKFFLEL